MLSKKHQRSSTSTKADMHHCCYCVSTKGKRGIAESLHAQITRARLTACEVGVFLREISQLWENMPTPSFSHHLSSWAYFQDIMVPSQRLRTTVLLSSGYRATVESWPNVRSSSTTRNSDRATSLDGNCMCPYWQSSKSINSYAIFYRLSLLRLLSVLITSFSKVRSNCTHAFLIR